MTAPTSSMTVPALLRKLERQLTDCGDPAGEAREILAAALGCSPHSLRLRYQEEIPPEQCEKAASMAERRASGEPLQYILGSWSFMGREYAVGEGVLIPRDDTEVLVGEALKMARRFPDPKIVDLCSGTGIIAITLEQELDNAEVFAVEKSEKAFAYLTENIRLNRSQVKAICADLSDCADAFADSSLDMIVSNPPYIRSDEITDLQKEVQFEPRMALDGGADGYDFYGLIVKLWSKKLKKSGVIAFELGEGQYDRVASLLQAAGYTDIVGYPDIQGITRAVTAQKSSLS